MQKRQYQRANDSYLRLSIGNAPWPIGVTMVGYVYPSNIPPSIVLLEALMTVRDDGPCEPALILQIIL